MRSTTHPVRGLLFLALCTALVFGTAVAYAAAGTTTRVSVSSGGAEGNIGSSSPSVSADGRYVAFNSTWSFVTSDTNATRDIFVRDRVAGTTVRASLDSSGNQGNGESSAPSISADGRYVAFSSGANNLVGGDANGKYDIFVRDLVASATVLVSVDSSEVQGDGNSEAPSISADGQYVAFVSRATNLVSGDTNDDYDVFVRDIAAGTTSLVSKSSTGGAGDGASNAPAISPDGHHVAFISSSTNLVNGDTNAAGDIFVRDLVAGTTRLVSVSSTGEQGNNQSMTPSVSTDGRYVAFASWATNLVPGDTNSGDDVFVRDVVDGTTSLVSVNSTGGVGDAGSYSASISADGRCVAFYSSATNLVAGDTNLTYDAFVRDRAERTTTRVSVDSSGVAGNGGSTYPVISAGGRYVVFTSLADNLVAGDTNLVLDVFFRDLGPLRGVTSLALTSRSKDPLAYGASFVVTGTLSSGGSGVSGQKVILQSAAPGAVFKDTLVQATTGANGVFSFSVKPKSKTYYRVRFAGSSAYLASGPTTTMVYATPRVSLGNPVAPKTMRTSKRYTVYGSLMPRHASGSKPVLVYKYKKVGGKWKPKGTVKAKAYNYKSYSRYKASVKLTSRGKWRLRAYAPADSGHAKTWSRGFDYVTVK